MIGEGFTLYNMLQIDNTLFDNIMLYEKIDKDVMLTEIFKRCGSLPCIDFNPDLYKLFVENFFKKYYNMFMKLYDSMYFEYNPLENLKRERTLKNQTVTENTRNATSESHSTDSNITNSENKISAMDSNDYQPDRTTDSDSTSTGDVNNTGNESENGKETFNEEESEHGTIGVITHQAMIEKERRVVRYDFYKEVAGIHENELCVSIY